jgi:hypothetical protein
VCDSGLMYSVTGSLTLLSCSEAGTMGTGSRYHSVKCACVLSMFIDLVRVFGVLCYL